MRIVTGPMTVSTRHRLPRNPLTCQRAFPARTLSAAGKDKTTSSSHSSDTGTDTASASAQVTSVTKLNKNFPRRERENSNGESRVGASVAHRAVSTLGVPYPSRHLLARGWVQIRNPRHSAALCPPCRQHRATRGGHLWTIKTLYGED